MSSNGTTRVLDVRPDLEAGREPLSRIMNAARTVPSGGTLVILAPFEPEPLYGILRNQGFTYVAEALSEGGFRVSFTRGPA